MTNNKYALATILALSAAVISGTNNFLTKIAVTAIKDPVVYTTLKNSLVAILLFGIILALKKWKEVSSLDRKKWLMLFAIGLIGGSLPFALYFTGLTQTTAVNASLIHKTLFIWVAFMAIPMLKEKIGTIQWIGIGAIFAANFFIGGWTGFKFNTGEIFILAATVLWAVENIIAKIALKDISSLTLVSARMILGSILLMAFVAWRGGGNAVFNLNAGQWEWTLLTSFLLLGFVLSWYGALKYAPATFVATLLVPATLITNALSAIFITRSFSATEAASAGLF